jgi:hypothetical protein
MGNPNVTQLEKRVKQPISRLHWQHMFALDDPFLQLAFFRTQRTQNSPCCCFFFLGWFLSDNSHSDENNLFNNPRMCRDGVRSCTSVFFVFVLDRLVIIIFRALHQSSSFFFVFFFPEEKMMITIVFFLR